VTSTPGLNLIECRRNAQECWAHANDAADEETKALFPQIAVAWEKLGTVVESLQRHRSLGGEPVKPSFRRSIFNGDVAAFDVAKIAQSFPKVIPRGGCFTDDPDASAAIKQEFARWAQSVLCPQATPAIGPSYVSGHVASGV
jgi:hypothetical protein